MKKTFKLAAVSLILIILSGFFTIAGATGTIRYVKENGTGSGDGSSWDNASDNLQAMINASAKGDQVFVAAGTYKPIYTIVGWSSTTPTATSGGRDNSFVLKDEVGIYGGFSAVDSELSIEERDFNQNITVLSGDLNGDDETIGISDNSYHVVVSANVTNAAVLDGFTITGGNANILGSVTMESNRTVYRGYGGGIHNCYSSPTIKNIKIIKNSARSGGGSYNANSKSPVYENVEIIENFTAIPSGTSSGGGMYNYYSGVTFKNGKIIGNSAVTDRKSTRLNSSH